MDPDCKVRVWVYVIMYTHLQTHRGTHMNTQTSMLELVFGKIYSLLNCSCTLYFCNLWSLSHHGSQYFACLGMYATM